MKNIAAVFFLFLVAFDPQVPLLPNGIGFTAIVAVLLFVPAMLKAFGNGFYYVKQSKPFFLIFLLCFIFILLRVILSQGGNVEFLLSFFKAFFVFLSTIFVFILFFGEGLGSKFIKMVAFVFVLNALINILAGTYPTSFEYLSVFRGESISESLGSNPYRNSFLSGSGYYSIGTAYGLIFLLLSFYVASGRVNSLYMLLSLLIIAIAGFVSARTSFFAIAPALLYIMLSRFIYFSSVSLLGGLLVLFLIDLPIFQPYRFWLLSFFDLASEGSGNYLLEQMYFWPGLDVFLYGQGSVNDGFFIYTDAGYMKDILFGGVVFLLLKLSFLGVFVLAIFRSYPLFAIFFSFAFLSFHFKGSFVYNNAQGMAVFYFIYFYLVGSKKKHRGVEI